MAEQTAAEVLRNFEGFRSKPYWDENAWRIGYGSDTITRSDGSIVRVKPGMTVTRDEAQADLDRRIPEFQQEGVIPYVGKDAWGALSEASKAAITSLAYNYGSLANLPSLRKAIQSGDAGAIADAVAARGVDNGGINRKRRIAEANIIRSHPIPQADIPNGFAYTKGGKPIDPENSFLMDRSDPRYGRAVAAKQAGTSAIPASISAMGEFKRGLDTPPKYPPLPAPAPLTFPSLSNDLNSFGDDPMRVAARGGVAERALGRAPSPKLGSPPQPMPRSARPLPPLPTSVPQTEAERVWGGTSFRDPYNTPDIMPKFGDIAATMGRTAPIPAMPSALTAFKRSLPPMPAARPQAAVPLRIVVPAANPVRAPIPQPPRVQQASLLERLTGAANPGGFNNSGGGGSLI